MLLDDNDRYERYVPPAADDLNASEWARLRSRLSGVVDGWAWSTETGLRLADIERLDDMPTDGGRVWYEAQDEPLALGLTETLSDALVALTLGGGVPDGPRAKLTGVDLAVLDLWAGRALEAVAGALALAPTRVRRFGGPPAGMSVAEPPLAGVRLQWAGKADGGRLVVGLSAVRGGDTEERARLGERPGPLLEVAVRVAARMRGPDLSLADVVELEVGDVIVMGDKDEVRVDLHVGEARVAHGRPGVRGGQMAVRVIEGASGGRLPNTTQTGGEL